LYNNRFNRLVHCWQHCIKQEGDYVEKWGRPVETKYTFWAICFVSCFILITCLGVQIQT
jgi:hypothetical protein